MNISFYWRTNKAFDPEQYDITPFGGAEISSLNLAKQFATRGHQVHIYCGALGSYDTGNLHFHPYSDTNKHQHEYFINVRLDPVISRRFPQIDKPYRTIVWSGDAYDQSNNNLLHDPMMRDSIDAFVCKSAWQYNTLQEQFYYPSFFEKMSIKYNGVNLDYYQHQNHDKNQFIHASVIFRGAENLLRLWPAIRAELGDVRLLIFSKLNLYTGSSQSDLQYMQLYNSLANMEGATMMEPVIQRELATHLCNSGIMLYPNTFLESSCGVALESMAAGTPVITTNMAGLAETVNMIGGGELIDRTTDYDNQFIERTCALWHDDKRRKKMAELSRQEVKDHSWTRVADRWLDFLKSL